MVLGFRFGVESPKLEALGLRVEGLGCRVKTLEDPRPQGLSLNPVP